MAAPAYLRAVDGGVILSVKVQPRASKNEVAGALGAELKVKVTAPPVDSAANEAVVRLLADLLGCARNRVELVKGQTARHKSVMLHGFTVEDLARRLS